MKIIEKKIDINIYNSKIFNEYFTGLSFCVFDIETTGLSPLRNSLILSGLLYKKDDNIVLNQFFAENLDEEPLILAKTKELLESFDYVITYNGASFDVPFLNQRLEINGIPPVKNIYNLDIYKLVRGYSPINKFTPNLKQKTLENYMGFWENRGDEISGKESIQLYYDFLESHSLHFMEKILLHNHDDVIQLYRLLEALKKCDLHYGFFKLGFPVKTFESSFIINSITIKNNRLLIEGLQSRNPKEANVFSHDGLEYKFNKANNFFKIAVPLEEHRNLVFLDTTKLNINTDLFLDNVNFESEYLIIQNNDIINYREVNLLIQSIFERISNYGL